MSDELDVLGVNEAFYDAFSRRDMDALERLWAEDGPLACVHPGWDAIRGKAAVLASFRAILEGGASPRIRCFDASAHLFGDVAFVVCRESVSGAEVVATNVFTRGQTGDDRWKMVHHHAGPVSARRPSSTPPPAKKKSDLN
jgi:ketosteroid isomerase-like protein